MSSLTVVLYLCDYDIFCLKFGMVLKLNFKVFLFNIFESGLLLGKHLSMIARNSLPTCVLTFMLKGGGAVQTI